MSLTDNDRRQVRSIFVDVLKTEGRQITKEEVRNEVASQLIPIKREQEKISGNIKAILNDIEDIYDMLKRLFKKAKLKMYES